MNNIWLLIFNVCEEFEFYQTIREKHDVITLSLFEGASLPATAAICFDKGLGSISKLLNENDRRPSDRSLLVAYGKMPKQSQLNLILLSQTESRPYSNPYDPHFFSQFAEKEPDETDFSEGHVVYTKQDDRLLKAGLSLFKPVSFEWTHESAMQKRDRLLKLLTLQLLAELFVSSSAELKSLPASLRRCIGQIQIDLYADFNDYCEAHATTLAMAAHSFVDQHPHAVSFESLLRVARGFSLSKEINQQERAWERWKQLLSNTTLSSEQLTRQFEIEIIREIATS